MNSLQIGFITATFTVPVICWLAARDPRPAASLADPKADSRPIVRGIAWTFSAILLGVFILATYFRFHDVRFSPATHLPMHLCDWAMVATLLALLGRSQAGFEITYCWGLAGTFQALLTPAWSVEGGPAAWCFLIFHSVIPAAVLWLIFMGWRPSARAWGRVFGWSQIYFVAAILVNAASPGSNYGFLARRPDLPTLLDKFPDPAGGWLYMLSIDAFGLALFALMLLPWPSTRHLTQATPVTAPSPATSDE